MQTTVTIHVQAPLILSNDIVFTPAVGPFQAPVKKGTVLGRIVVNPIEWSGDLSLSGSDSSFFGIVSPNLDVVAVQDLVDGRDYQLSISATP